MKFNQIINNSFNYETELCQIGFKFGTDKSPLCKDSHSYTPFYNLLFSSLRYRDIVFGEIGIYKNSSMKMWREYFTNATLYGWDCKPEQNDEERYKIDFIESAKKENLINTIYDYINVKDDFSILESLKKTNKKFDIIIDDSDHYFWSQIRLIGNLPLFLKPGGLFVIEDVNNKIYEFFNVMEQFGHDKFYSTFTQVKTYHQSQKYGSDCDELIVLVRNGVEV
jgi:SAM-dependent methyltransferase